MVLCGCESPGPNATPAASPQCSLPVTISFHRIDQPDADASKQIVAARGSGPIRIQPRVEPIAGENPGEADVVFMLFRNETSSEMQQLDYQRLRGVDLGRMRLAGKVLTVPTDHEGMCRVVVEIHRDGRVVCRDELRVSVETR
jgi:hypothetical protein